MMTDDRCNFVGGKVLEENKNTNNFSESGAIRGLEIYKQNRMNSDLLGIKFERKVTLKATKN